MRPRDVQLSHTLVSLPYHPRLLCGILMYMYNFLMEYVRRGGTSSLARESQRRRPVAVPPPHCRMLQGKERGRVSKFLLLLCVLCLHAEYTYMRHETNEIMGQFQGLLPLSVCLKE